MAEANKLYFISCGPGDPGLITVKGLRTLERCPFVLLPVAYESVFAESLVGKELESPFEMDRAELVGWINERLTRGPVALLVPGDFSLFNPFQSYVADFEGRCEVIPGVSAHVAAMSLIHKSLDIPEVAYASVVTSPRAYTRDGRARVTEVAGPGKTLVLYMNDRPAGQLASELMEAYPPETPIAIFEEIGSPREFKTIATLATIDEVLGGRDPFGIGSESPEPTLALVIVGDAVINDEAPKWWTHRLEKIWKPRGMR